LKLIKSYGARILLSRDDQTKPNSSRGLTRIFADERFGCLGNVVVGEFVDLGLGFAGGLELFELFQVLGGLAIETGLVAVELVEFLLFAGEGESPEDFLGFVRWWVFFPPNESQVEMSKRTFGYWDLCGSDLEC
jgi:hypothetical protein